MELETKIYVGLTLVFLAGLFIGWYATYMTYHEEMAKRKIIEDFKAKEVLKSPIRKKYENMEEILSALRLLCGAYYIKDGSETWIYEKQQNE